MYLPSLKKLRVTREEVNSFGGYVHTGNTPAGAFYETKNLCSDEYPRAATRKQRVKCAELQRPGGLYAKAELAWVSMEKLYYAGQFVGRVSAGKKTFCGMGAYLLIWPDKLLYNTQKTPDGTDLLERLERLWSTEGTVNISLTMLGGEYEEGSVWYGPTAPEDTERYKYWVDTASKPNVLYMHADGAWAAIDSTYIKISAAGIGEGLAEYDAVKISGCAAEELNGDFAVYECAENYIKVAGIISKAVSQQGGLSVNRTVPEMEYLCECNNRVWGCSAENVIYSCVLGNPRNWNRYMGLADDAYSVTVGTDGPFTGAVSYGGTVYFFKEDYVHKVYGTMPSNFQVSASPIRGVQNGSEASIAVCNEMLVYKGREGVYAFDGSSATRISEALGNEVYRKAVCGARNGKYYMSCVDAQQAAHLFVYDMAHGVWYHEDDLRITDFAALNGELYGLAEDGRLWCMNGDGYGYAGENEVEKEEVPEWELTTGQLFSTQFDAKYLNRLLLRFTMEAGSSLRVTVQDDDGRRADAEEWRDVLEVTAQDYPINRAFTVPVQLRRCDHARLRICGRGQARLEAYALEVVRGGENR